MKPLSNPFEKEDTFSDLIVFTAKSEWVQSKLLFLRLWKNSTLTAKVVFWCFFMCDSESCLDKIFVKLQNLLTDRKRIKKTMFVLLFHVL